MMLATWQLLVAATLCGIFVPLCAGIGLRAVKRIARDRAQTYGPFIAYFLSLIAFSMILVLLSRQGANPALLVLCFMAGVGVGRLVFKR